jgi:hypothetical protein
MFPEPPLRENELLAPKAPSAFMLTAPLLMPRLIELLAEPRLALELTVVLPSVSPRKSEPTDAPNRPDELAEMLSDDCVQDSSLKLTPMISPAALRILVSKSFSPAEA